MTLADNALLRVVATFTLKGGSKAQNVYHVKLDMASGCSDSEAVDCALAYVEDIMDPLTARIDDEVSLEGIELYTRIGSEWAPVGTKAGTWEGSSVNDQMPAGCALLLKAYKPRTGYADKKFISGITDDQAIGDLWASGVITDGEAAAAVWAEDYTDGTVIWEPVSWSEKYSVETDYSHEYSVSSVVAYQRRRKPGVGF